MIPLREGPGQPELDERGDEAMDADDSQAPSERRGSSERRHARRDVEREQDAPTGDGDTSPRERPQT